MASVPSFQPWTPLAARCCELLALTLAWVLLAGSSLNSWSISQDFKTVLYLCALQKWRFLGELLRSDIMDRMVLTRFHPWDFGLGALVAIMAWIDPLDILPAMWSSRDVDQDHEERALQPRIFPCRTSHARMFPTPHAFSYSYLYVGIPVGWVGSANNVLSSHTSSHGESSVHEPSRTAWFSIRSEDYLERLDSRTSLQDKLNDYLTKLGEDPHLFPHAYLLTAPRFLGFSFNPVSFWYLYSAENTLAAMVLEVNNTFDERRMYFLQKKSAQSEEDKGQTIFECVWDKDFHVSPFNDRSGYYSLRATDPFAPGLCGAGQVDNVITLMSSDGRPKVVARVFSAEESILASTVGRLKAAHLICRWWWVGFMTNVRILKEARKLWVKGLQVFYRPEVFRTSIGRSATSDEDFLAEKFLTFLQSVQKRSSGTLFIKYTAAAGKHRGRTLTVSSEGMLNLRDNKNTGTVLDPGDVTTLYVLSPAFYSNFFRCPNPVTAFETLCQCPVESERLGVLSNPSQFLRRVRDAQTTISNQPKTIDAHHLKNRLSYLRQNRISRFITLSLGPRFLSSAKLLPLVPAPDVKQAALIDEMIFDAILGQESARRYYRIISQLLLCDRIAFGSVSLLRVYGYAIRYVFLWGCATRLCSVIDAICHIWA